MMRRFIPTVAALPEARPVADRAFSAYRAIRGITVLLCWLAVTGHAVAEVQPNTVTEVAPGVWFVLRDSHGTGLCNLDYAQCLTQHCPSEA